MCSNSFLACNYILNAQEVSLPWMCSTSGVYVIGAGVHLSVICMYICMYVCI